MYINVYSNLPQIESDSLPSSLLLRGLTGMLTLKSGKLFNGISEVSNIIACSISGLGQI